MQLLPAEGSKILQQFRALFTKRTFATLVTLLYGTLLATGSRTICTALRFCGLGEDKTFCNYHRFLSRARWNALKASRILLRLLVDAFCSPDEPLVFGIDETIERRRGAQIKAKGIYRDPVRSSFPCPLCEVPRPAVDVSDAAYHHPVGQKSMGPALSHRPGTFRALLRRLPQRQAQENNRLGKADDPDSFPLGGEPQRQWSDKAIARTTPCLMGLFSVTVLWADELYKAGKLVTGRTVWYEKKRPTFSDALAAVRTQLWGCHLFCTSAQKGQTAEISQSWLNFLTDRLARAA